MSSNGGALGTGSYDEGVAKATVASMNDTSPISSSDPNIAEEKGEVVSVRRMSVATSEYSTGDPFPEDPDSQEEAQQFTVRAVLVGCILGGVIAAANVYLGLKTGWTFGASLFGSIFGFAILKPLSKILPSQFGGGYFGPKENVCCQSAATAAGSLGLLFASGFPAAYQLGLLGKSPKEDFAKLITFTACCAYYGMFFAIPLRKLYVVKQKLVFPSATAAAHTIRSMHVGKNAEVYARKKTNALAVAFALAITWRCVSEYAPGIMWDWHWGWTFYRLGWHGMIYAENWNWVWEWTPAFIGVGLLVGPNSAYSFSGGAVLAWGIIGPALVTTGKAFGEAASPEYPGYMNYMGMVLDDPVHQPSPRYWLIWPGTLLLITGAFAELFANYKMLWKSFVHLLSPFIRKFRQTEMTIEAVIDDPAPPHEQVPWWMWSGGLLLSCTFTCIVLGFQYGQNVGVSIISIIFAFIFSFIGAESCGRTNIIPVTSLGNATQLVVGGVTKGHYSVPDAQLLNITGGMVALAASEQSADMLGDLKTTHLLRASPRVQFYAQMVGALVSIFMSVGIYVLFSEAYPCINSLAGQDHCAFPAPDVAAYRAIAIAVTAKTTPIPPSSGYTAIALGIFSIAMTIVKYRWIPVNKQHFVPNFVAMGIAFILNTTTYPTAVAFGATVALLWKRNFPMAFGMYCYAVAAGMIAGEGLGGIVGAVLQIAKVSGSYKGTFDPGHNGPGASKGTRPRPSITERDSDMTKHRPRSSENTLGAVVCTRWTISVDDIRAAAESTEIESLLRYSELYFYNSVYKDRSERLQPIIDHKVRKKLHKEAHKLWKAARELAQETPMAEEIMQGGQRQKDTYANMENNYQTKYGTPKQKYKAAQTRSDEQSEELGQAKTTIKQAVEELRSQIELEKLHNEIDDSNDAK
ncbi:putative oligopeptide transporter [Phaeomoniella chlamydospora]|uniref:Putative oligopeptide transporter n=1 Tax=Phaeomoniella chlamydospora TaxID=158046 RepID=A0A0G2G3F4_PHACM|nr:putative oligopeptide transporter [Phaeomoniella chlamydospora]